MKQRTLLGSALLALGTAGAVATLSLTRAQTPGSPEPGPVKRAAHAESGDAGAAMVRPAAAAARDDPATPAPALRRLHASARSGVEWLVRVDNPVNGRFLPGWLPALNSPLEQDDYLRQVGAAYALARAARYFGDERYLMKARQAVLSLLADTRADPADPACRVTTLPTIMVDPLAAAGLLLLTIHELTEPADELLQQGEELCNLVRKHQQTDGSFRYGDPASAETQPGLALHGLVLSLRNRPAPWKLEVAAKAQAYYRRQWRVRPDLALAAGLTPAFAEAYVRTRDKVYADFVFEMCDWACDQQYGQDAGEPKWAGGFRPDEGRRSAHPAPDVRSAAAVRSLSLGCLVTRYARDNVRWERYRRAAELGAQFLVTLQYTEANTLHFTPGYRPALIGGFHASLRDGDLRLDYNQHATLALMERLTGVGDR